MARNALEPEGCVKAGLAKAQERLLFGSGTKKAGDFVDGVFSASRAKEGVYFNSEASQGLFGGLVV